MADKGGRIPPDGRPHVAPGVGKNARRHDLEQPATPGLHGSDLQKGDVQQFERGQRIQPIRTQRPAETRTRSGRRVSRRRRPQRGGPKGAPDPVSFLKDRLGGTLTTPSNRVRGAGGVDVRPFLPLLRRLSTASGASGVVAQAYITQFGNAVRSPMEHTTPMVDMQEADAGLEDALRRLGS